VFPIVLLSLATCKIEGAKSSEFMEITSISKNHGRTGYQQNHSSPFLRPEGHIYAREKLIHLFDIPRPNKFSLRRKQESLAHITIAANRESCSSFVFWLGVCGVAHRPGKMNKFIISFKNICPLRRPSALSLRLLLLQLRNICRIYTYQYSDSCNK
jgi:hypothetical protein